MDLIDIYRIFQTAAAQDIYLSEAHGMFSKKDHILGHKTNFTNKTKLK
jgi:hypothetical protein